MTVLRVLRSGMLTTVQDPGRWGHQGSGVPVAGPMDLYSFRVANRLVGNPDDRACLEVTLVGPEVQARGTVVCAVAGADFELLVDGRPVHTGRALEVRSGSTLRFGSRLAGARAYLAVRGGLDVAAAFGSRATSLVSGMGPFGGRPLGAGDELPVGLPGPGYSPVEVPFALPLPAGSARLRAMPGPHERLFAAGALDRFFSAEFLVTPRSNRMGYRLDGEALEHAGRADVLSEATPMGSVQVPGDGRPILLMADRQTAGGYPKIATVITADLPVAGQLAPGDRVRFVRCTRGEALDALHRQELRLAGRIR